MSRREALAARHSHDPEPNGLERVDTLLAVTAMFPSLHSHEMTRNQAEPVLNSYLLGTPASLAYQTSELD